MREFLWAGRNSNLRYVGNDGNIALTGTSKGAVSLWVNTAWSGLYCCHSGSSYSHIFSAYANANNLMRLEAYRPAACTLRFVVDGNASVKTISYTIDAAIWPADTWHHIVITWDFSGGAGAGILHMYLNGAEVGTAVTDATAFTTAPPTIDVGWLTGMAANRGLGGFMDNVAIWNGVMTPAQVLALYTAGRRKPVVDADGTGTLTFLAEYNGTYDATVHAGTATATITTAAQSARVKDGATEVGKRWEAHFGTGTDRSRIAGEMLFFRGIPGVAAPDYTEPVDGDHFTYLTTAWNVNPLVLRNCTGWTRRPHILTIKLLIEAGTLADDEYITVGQTDGPRWRLYNNRIVDEANAAHIYYITMDDSYLTSDKFVTLAFYELPLSSGTGYHYLMVNGASLIDGTADMTVSGSWVIDTAQAGMPTSTVTIKIESIEVYGPCDYQESDSVFDDFLQAYPFWDFKFGTALPTGKIWRATGIERTLCTPTKHAGNPVIYDGEAWVELWCDLDYPLFTRYCYMVQKDDATIRFAWCTDNADGTRELIFADSADGIAWTEDPANPIMDLTTIQGPWGEWDRGYSFGVRIHLPTLVDPYGVLVMIYHSSDDVDRYEMGAMFGGADEYSFTAAHKYAENPILRAAGHGDGKWGNRDLSGPTARNLWPAADGNNRYLAFCRRKTVWIAQPYAKNVRHLVVRRSCDLRQWVPIGNTSEDAPAWGSESAEGFAFAEQCAKDRLVGFSYCWAGSGLYGIVTEDFILFEAPWQPLVAINTQPAWESPGYQQYRPGGWCRIGDDWLIFYLCAVDGTHGGIGLATIKKNRLAYLSLSAGQTSRSIETCAFTRPTTGWWPLLLNANTREGAITVAVLDGDTKAEVPGYGAGNMDAWSGDHVNQEVMWGGHGLDELTGASYALRFALTRPGAGDDSPMMYSFEALEPTEPSVVTITCYVTGGVVPIPNACVYVWNNARDTIQNWGVTDALGQVAMPVANSPAGLPFKVVIPATGTHAFTVHDLTVHGDTAATYYGTAYTAYPRSILVILAGAVGDVALNAPVRLVQGKYGDALTFRLMKRDLETPEDLTIAVSARFAMWKHDERTVVAAGDCPITDPLNGEVQYLFTSPQLEETGRYEGQVLVLWPDGNESPWPPGDPQEFRIRESNEP